MVNAINPRGIGWGVLPPAGTNAGDQKRGEFYAAMLAILGDCRLLWTPDSADTTTSTTKDRYAATITWDATIAARKSTLGSGLALGFDGAANEGDIPDNDRYSFGNGAVDSAFSLLALANPTLGTTVRSLIGKESAALEWWWCIGADETLRLRLGDASAAADMGQISDAAITVGAWSLLGATYDGSRAPTGVSLFQNAAKLASSASVTGTYVAMENGASLIQIGNRQADLFWADSMAMLAITAKALTIDEQWAIKALVNGYFDLAL